MTQDHRLAQNWCGELSISWEIADFLGFSELWSSQSSIYVYDIWVYEEWIYESMITEIVMKVYQTLDVYALSLGVEMD